MRVLFDISHPAHVHFFKYMWAELEAAGHATLVVSREKDVTTDLLDAMGTPHTPVGRSGAKSRARQGAELLRRDWEILRLARRFRPDAVLTRNPSGVQAARLLRNCVGVFDTDDGRSVGVHFRAAAPFADIITTPDCTTEDYGPKHRRYPGYKALAYLHPARFTPDPSVLELLGVADEPYFVVRFVAFVASHDRGVYGIDAGSKRKLVEMLQAHGRVFVSSESPLPPDLAPLALPTPADRIHDVLAFANLYTGDSGSMAAEAALLGTPTAYCGSFYRQRDYLRELEDRYELLIGFRPESASEYLAAVEQLVATPSLREVWQQRRSRMLAEKTDVVAWYLDLVRELTGSA